MSDLPRIDEDEISRARASFDTAVHETAQDLTVCDTLFRRVRQFERDRTALMARLDRLENLQGHKPIPAPPEPQSRVIEPVAPARLDLPSEGELLQLRDLCARVYPSWCSSSGFVHGYMRGDLAYKDACDLEWIAQLKRAIGAISQLNVLERPNHKFGMDHYLDMATPILRRIHLHRELRPGMLVLGAFPMRVPVAGFSMESHVTTLGLDEYLGKPVDPSAWRQTLREGRLPAQFADGGRRFDVAPSPVRVVYF